MWFLEQGSVNFSSTQENVLVVLYVVKFLTRLEWTFSTYFRYPDALGIADVYAALNSQSITDFLTNKFLGVEENNGLPKLDRWQSMIVQLKLTCPLSVACIILLLV